MSYESTERKQRKKNVRYLEKDVDFPHPILRNWLQCTKHLLLQAVLFIACWSMNSKVHELILKCFTMCYTTSIPTYKIHHIFLMSLERNMISLSHLYSLQVTRLSLLFIYPRFPSSRLYSLSRHGGRVPAHIRGSVTRHLLGLPLFFFLSFSVKAEGDETMLLRSTKKSWNAFTRIPNLNIEMLSIKIHYRGYGYKNNIQSDRWNSTKA